MTFEEDLGDVTLSLADGVGRVMLNRAPVNALRTDTWTALGAAFARLRGEPGCQVVVLGSSTAGIFSAGADVKELPMPPARDEARQVLARSVLEAVLGSPVPVLCAVSGPALGGGCVLAAAADVRFADQSARFGLPEMNVGRFGGASHLMRLLPQGVVRHMYFTSEPIDAPRAYELGLVQELLDDAAALAARVDETAAQIARRSPTALRMGKQSLDLAELMDVRTGYAIEQQFSLRMALTPDAAEAAAAFREKRAPNWPEMQEDH